jgi:hypothetical protein
MRTVGPFNPDLRFPDERPPDEELESAINAGTRLGVSALQEKLKKDAELLLNLIGSNFQMELPQEEQVSISASEDRDKPRQ